MARRKKAVPIAAPAPTARPARAASIMTPRQFQWILPTGHGSGTILTEPPARVILAPEEDARPVVKGGLPPLLGPDHAQRATHEDTFPPIPPARPAPDFYPGAVGELQQAPIASSDKSGSLSYETNMAAFESQDPWGGRPSASNVGYSSIKTSFRR